MKRLQNSVQVVGLIFMLIFALGDSAAAQDDIVPAPPPTKIISREERSRLDSEKDLKGRTKVYVELMNSRLTTAEKLSSAEDFNAMFSELGSFQALMDGCISGLIARNASGGKVLDQFKKLDITLRGYGTRLEIIRRELPIRYENYMLSLIRAVRDTRTKAIDPLFGDTVLPGSRPN